MIFRIALVFFRSFNIFKVTESTHQNIVNNYFKYQILEPGPYMIFGSYVFVCFFCSLFLALKHFKDHLKHGLAHLPSPGIVSFINHV